MELVKSTIKYFRLLRNLTATRNCKTEKSIKYLYLRTPIYNFLAMMNDKQLRHAQTQYGGEGTDLENILLFKSNLCTFSHDQEKQNGVTKSHEAEHKTSETETLRSSVSEKCVWFYDLEHNLVENESKAEILPASQEEMSELQSSAKRKAEDSEEFKNFKKLKMETKMINAKRPGFTEKRYNETSYYMENGLRKVYPYYYTFTTYTKGRWVGEKILDIFAREFRAQSVEEYERCIKAGSITINNEKIPFGYRLKHNDLLANYVHRHEVPVTSQSIEIVHMDEDIVAVNKPASIPVHPCGRYRHNTVVFILAKEYNLKNLRTIHRLDRLTSGLLLFGRNSKKAQQMEQHIRKRQVQKEYICRVEGDFPEGVIECKEPIDVVSYKIGVCKVSPKGKDCTTTFQKISYNGKTSVVLCKPLTGRMHQIRVHLQYLGFPICNDPLYNHEVFGPLKGRGGDIGGRTDEELVRDLINIHNAENWLGIEGDSDLSMFKSVKKDSAVEAVSLCSEAKVEDNAAASPQNKANEILEVAVTNAANHSSLSSNAETDNGSLSCDKTVTRSPVGLDISVATQTGYESPDKAFDVKKMTIDEHCYECKVRYRDPKPADLVMYLHALKYRGPEWEFETELPAWATDDWTESA